MASRRRNAGGQQARREESFRRMRIVGALLLVLSAGAQGQANEGSDAGLPGSGEPAATISRPTTATGKSAVASSVIYVSTSGDDFGDGQSWGTAKKTLQSAVTALPGCTANTVFYAGSYADFSFDHCGTIYVGAGTFPLSTSLSIHSPYVAIYGISAVATKLSYTGRSGCAVYWTEKPFQDEFIGFGGLYNLQIDGYGAGAGTCGLETDDASAFRMAGVLISNFAGAGSIGWYDHATRRYSEKMIVQAQFRNNNTNWRVTPEDTAPGYPKYTTFGYGHFIVDCEVFAGQTCLRITNGQLALSFIKLSINMIQSNSNGIVVENSGGMVANLLALHIEAPQGVGTGHEIAAPKNAWGNIGLIDQDHPESNLFGSEMFGWTEYQPNFHTSGNNRAKPNTLVRLNACPLGGGVPGCNAYDLVAMPQATYSQLALPSGVSQDTLVSRASLDTLRNKTLSAPVVSGAVSPRDMRLKLTDQGQCTMNSGTCTAQRLGSPYETAPLCTVTWTGNGRLHGQLKVASTATTVTPSSSVDSDTAQVNWMCFGN